MPKRTDLKKILVIGSGPIVIGQAAEFDYAGTQACLALREEGYEVILCNSNPATIMTDESIADKVYMEPLTLEFIAKIIRMERPDAILPGIGGQTGLNLAMRLEKKGASVGYEYVFDAKYRINAALDGSEYQRLYLTPGPQEDDINTMHRYRDAIYYQNGGGELKKEVIGGYILFPGDGERTAVEMSKYYKSISDVNIGAFPLRPGNDDSRQLLVDFIAKLLEKKAKAIVTEVIPQKGTVVSVKDRVLVGIVKRDEQAFEDGTATIYYSGPKFPTTISLDGLHYFVPYIKDKGIRDIYEITKIRTITSREAKGDKDAGDDLRLAFELGTHRQLFNDYQSHELEVQYSFTDTTVDNL